MTPHFEFNARPVPPSEVAKSFIPPERHFASLLGKNHTLVLGPRGSGKTTLFKMLTVRALRNWQHPKAVQYGRDIGFNAVFIPTDNAWGKQIEALEDLDANPARKEAAFVIHSLRALISAMREATELAKIDDAPHLRHLAVPMSAEQEEQFVKLVRGPLKIDPVLNSLLGVESALEALLDAINSGEDAEAFSVETLPTKVSLVISAFNGVSNQDERRWALLYDELEIAPARIRRFLLSGRRGFDSRVVIKLAMAPYMGDSTIEQAPTSPFALHDYNLIQLTYPNKEDAVEFTRELFASTFLKLGFEVSSLADLFASPPDGYGFGRRVGKTLQRRAIPPEFRSLAAKDESFQQYVSSRKLFSSRYSFDENTVAQDIRKVLPIVIARDYYLRRFSEGKAVWHRPRKAHTLYTGYPSVIEITEGNPRAILTLVTPLAQELYRALREGKQPRKISSALQTEAVGSVELLLTSLLQVIPLDVGGFQPARGLLDFVDQIGRAFEARLLRQPFHTDYVGTFTLDESASPQIVNAVGKALNAGAIIHVPYPGSNADVLLKGLKQQRFRLSYTLSARYRLLLTLGDRILLSKLLLETRGVHYLSGQTDLFDTQV